MSCPKCGRNHMSLDTDVHGVKTISCIYCGYQESDKYPRRPGEKEKEYQKRLIQESRSSLAAYGIKPNPNTVPKGDYREWLELAGVIRSGMEQRSLSAQGLADEIRISRKTLNNYLSGLRRPKAGIAQVLEKALSITIMQFYPQHKEEAA